VGDLHRLQDYSQVRNIHQEFRDDKRTEKHHDEPPVKSIQFMSELCPYEPFLEAIKIPSQLPGDRSIKSPMINEWEDDLTGKHKKRVSLPFNGSSPTSPKRKPLRATKSFDEHDFVDNLGGHRVPHKSSKDNFKSGTASAEPPTPLKAKGAPTPRRSVQPQSSLDRGAKPKKARDVSTRSQRTQPQLGSAVSSVDGADGSRSKLDTRTRRNQKATVVYVTRHR
jgi:hypothetical protein